MDKAAHCRALHVVSGLYYVILNSSYLFQCQPFIETLASRGWVKENWQRKGEVDEHKKQFNGNYRRTRDHGKTRVPANSVFPVYEGRLRSNEVTAGMYVRPRVKGKNRALIKIKAQARQIQTILNDVTLDRSFPFSRRPEKSIIGGIWGIRLLGPWRISTYRNFV